MKNLKINEGQANEINIAYHDLGEGKPLILIHGWPSTSAMFESQLTELPKKGIRCIAYDRRGFGKSDQPFSGYDYDTLASDLDQIIKKLDLKDVTLLGFSMGGGEVVRYLSKFNTEGRVTKAILASSIIPFIKKTEDNPKGVPIEMIDGFADNIKADRPAFMASFLKNFFGDKLIASPVSKEFLDWNVNLCMQASPIATLECMYAWAETDFREEARKIAIPTLIIHGDADTNVPLELAGKQASEIIPNNKFLIYKGQPHGLVYTDKDQFNKDVVTFIG
ncbi:alpha/beta hydrolase [Pedobacter sp. SD-b]|uniref:Alpha/beta hydrolase n=1 Tax=Pedobacter segetis TaxID=2793069 RepID=A0ABS1BJZ4_9SPHI|nr:alpha/beta hydrolase [Pedobacter segetis]MBK0383197.1 alpha/beta hydrolase [Pedobacter segetis]